MPKFVFTENGWDEQEKIASSNVFVKKPDEEGKFVRLRVLSKAPATFYTCYVDNVGMIMYPGEEIAKSYIMPDGNNLEDGLDWELTKSMVVWVYDDPKDLTQGSVQVWEPSKMTWDDLVELKNDEEYGHPVQYDLKWMCTQAKPRRYSLTPYPAAAVSAEVAAEIKENWISLKEFHKIPTVEYLDRKFSQSGRRPGAGRPMTTSPAEGNLADFDDGLPPDLGV